MQRLLDIMQRLRDPEHGCPWDAQQNFATIAPYTIEEAYEVADAITRGDMGDLRDELGDLLFQVVFHAQMAHEQGHFDFGEVHRAVCEKMIERHPHVFADRSIDDAEHQTRAWEEYKAEERKARGEYSLMDGVPPGMSELIRALKLQKRAARAGFDWDSPEPVLEKCAEELDEMRQATASGDREAMEAELGDLLFATINLARKLGIDPGSALRRSNAKFDRRFRSMEKAAGNQDALIALDLDAQEELWRQAKRKEGKGS
jgi:ATP diphosphatase